jgi:hypothetical protein
MSNKDFKVKNKLIIGGASQQGPLVIDSQGNVDGTAYLTPLQGGTGTTTAPTAGQFLYSASGTNYAPATLSSYLSPAWTSTSVSSNVSLSAWNNYFVNTSSATTLTLPASPNLGDEIHVFDATGNAGTNNITVNSNSNKINGTVQDATLDVNNVAAVFIYTGSTYGWRLN